MRFETPQQLLDFRQQMKEAARPMRVDLATRFGVCQSYYIGVQWINDNYRLPGPYRSFGRYNTDWSPDSLHLRATVNRITRYTIKSSAATHPNDIAVDVFPSESEYGMESVEKSRVIEGVANAAIKASGFLGKAQMANIERAISGSYILGLYLHTKDRPIMNESGQVVMTRDTSVRATCFDPYRMIVDPAQTDPDLSRHDYLGYVDVWTADKIERVYGVKLDREKLPTVAELAPMEVEIGRLTRGQLYQDYLTYSKSKGAQVEQWHFRDEDGRWGRWYIIIEGEAGKPMVLNWENPETPFGGNGLPFVHMRGHHKPKSVFCIGDVSMLRDDQDRLNTIWSMVMRVIQKSSGFQWTVDAGAFPTGQDPDTIRNNFTNSVAGVVIYGRGAARRDYQEPKLVQTPPPHPMYIDMVNQIGDKDMQEQVFRADINRGVGKSHVPHATSEILIREANQVLGIRAQNDAESYAKLIDVLTCTYVRLAQEMSPSVLGILQREGLNDNDFAVLSQIDPYYCSCQIKVREGSSRYRDPKERQETLDTALMNQAMTPTEWRTARAADIDAPLIEDDRMMTRAIDQMVADLNNGIPWTPKPLGPYGEYALSRMRIALVSRKAQQNPELTSIIMQAIEMQRQMNAVELAGAQGMINQPATNEGPAQMQTTTLGALLSGGVA